MFNPFNRNKRTMPESKWQKIQARAKNLPSARSDTAWDEMFRTARVDAAHSSRAASNAATGPWMGGPTVGGVDILSGQTPGKQKFFTGQAGRSATARQRKPIVNTNIDRPNITFAKPINPAMAEGAGATLAGTGGKFLTGMNKNPLYKWGMTGGLGLVAMNRARKAYDSARNGDIGNAAVNTALAGAAGYGAYLAYLPHSQAASHLRRIQGGWLGRNASHATKDVINMKYSKDAINFVGNTLGGKNLWNGLVKGLRHV